MAATASTTSFDESLFRSNYASGSRVNCLLPNSAGTEKGVNLALRIDYERRNSSVQNRYLRSAVWPPSRLAPSNLRPEYPGILLIEHVYIHLLLQWPKQTFSINAQQCCSGMFFLDHGVLGYCRRYRVKAAP